MAMKSPPGSISLRRAGISFRLDPELGFSVTARRGRVSGNNGRLDVFRLKGNL